MEALHDNVFLEFMKGNHVMRHNPLLWNSIRLDMFIESTVMWSEHEVGGLVRRTLEPSAVS